MHHLPPLLLASQSPRRKQILESLGLLFSSADPKDILEKHPSHQEVEEVTCWNAVKKAESLLSQVSEETVVIGCDTLVVLGKEVLGKPKDQEAVLQTLAKLSDNTHTVVSGLALISKRFGKKEAIAKTKVHFKKIDPHAIFQYSLTREPYDKAGSYAVQGMGTLFIDRLEGSYTNVMGFPLETFLTLLPEFTKLPLHQWFMA